MKNLLKSKISLCLLVSLVAAQSLTALAFDPVKEYGRLLAQPILWIMHGAKVAQEEVANGSFDWHSYTEDDSTNSVVRQQAMPAIKGFVAGCKELVSSTASKTKELVSGAVIAVHESEQEMASHMAKACCMAADKISDAGSRAVAAVKDAIKKPEQQGSSVATIVVGGAVSGLVAYGLYKCYGWLTGRAQQKDQIEKEVKQEDVEKSVVQS